VLGADAQAHGPRHGRHGQGRARGRHARPFRPHVEDVHGRRADEARHELGRRAVVELHGRPHLLDAAPVQDHDLVGHGHGLDLVVGDVDHRGAQLAMERLQLHAHLHAELGVEVRQRLVEQEHLGLLDDGPPDGDALALPARELRGLAVEIGLQLQDARGLRDARIAVGGGQAVDPHAEVHVPAHRHVRVERVGLEHHGHVALGGREPRHVPPADGHAPRARPLQPRDDAQERGLAAARRAHEDRELPVGHLQRHVAERRLGAEALAHAPQADLGHAPSPARFSVDRTGARYIHMSGATNGCQPARAGHTGRIA
jgi:hypothetical protein